MSKNNIAHSSGSFAGFLSPIQFHIVFVEEKRRLGKKGHTHRLRAIETVRSLTALTIDVPFTMATAVLAASNCFVARTTSKRIDSCTCHFYTYDNFSTTRSGFRSECLFRVKRETLCRRLCCSHCTNQVLYVVGTLPTFRTQQRANGERTDKYIHSRAYTQHTNKPEPICNNYWILFLAQRR